MLGYQWGRGRLRFPRRRREELRAKRRLQRRARSKETEETVQEDRASVWSVLLPIAGVVAVAAYSCWGRIEKWAVTRLEQKVSRRVYEQEGLRKEVVQRVHRVRCGEREGTCFGVNVGPRSYLVTAAHVIAPVASGAVRVAELQISTDTGWQELSGRPIYPRNWRPEDPSLDLVALEVSWRFPGTVAVTVDALQLGQRVFFLGYPSNMGTQVAGRDSPLVRAGTVSGWSGGSRGGLLLVDGMNEHGMSGGPLLYRLANGGIGIAGVVAARREQPEPVWAQAGPQGPRVLDGLFVKPSMGILYAPTIDTIVDAIKQGSPQ